ncbi:ArnT family glycosyltransferase [Tenacibaculum soleae]|uniref:ArnT family glycosyltransferase n=1 Tax=Tenacibaculum soleae TaxID=447689 RepID=UPI0026E2288D|nr:glycosyltransferase family 39 protein [Tenacibaculum soleae]MDO6813398.1 glycosyltransferase family 39 protein [Tenacibaculum soleae]
MRNLINKKNFFAISVLLLVLWRAFLNGAIPLMDKTEARYAEIARIMAETNDYITPQIDYGVPFWAKPPLSTWLSALSFDVFGVSEFTARLPYLLLSILMIFLIGKYAKRENLPFFLPGFIALTIPEFLIHAGVVSTDTSLAFSVAIVMLSFWEAMHHPEKPIWKYLIFVGFGLGLLAKGPIIFILTLPPIFVWSLISKSFKKIFKTFPIFLGILIIVLIAIPWYYLAEQKTPGFIDYFIVGEHFSRFFDSSWSGDKYGFPKQQPLGIIWVFLLVFALPWVQMIIGKLWKNKATFFTNKWTLFLSAWLIWTPLFFTVSKSLIHPYILPVLIPIALLVVHFWKETKQKTVLIAISLIVPIATIIVYSFALISNNIEKHANSDKYFIQNSCKEDIQIYHYNTKSYSSQFYSKGKVKSIKVTELEKELLSKTPFYLIVSKRNLKKVVPSNNVTLKLINSNAKKNLYRAN